MKEKLAKVYGDGVEGAIRGAKAKDKPLHLFEYRLYGISTHHGSIYGGHYVAHVRHGDSWYYASDSSVSKESLSDALRSEAYVLFYERIWE